jgi:hypothetical protein
VFIAYGGPEGSMARPMVEVASPEGGRFGTAVAGAGDLNGDGYADLTVGAPLAPGFGRVYVYLGGRSGLATTPGSVLVFPGTPSTILGSGFGTALAGGCDLNGDGYTDLAAGAYGASDTSEVAGAVHVYGGRSMELSRLPVMSRIGPAANGRFGSTVACAGDLDGDGFDDLLVTSAHRALVEIFRGGASGISEGPSAPVPDPLGMMSDAAFGQALSVRDVNANGRLDLLVGAPFASPTSARGRVYVFHNMPGSIVPPVPSTTLVGPFGAGLGQVF